MWVSCFARDSAAQPALSNAEETDGANFIVPGKSVQHDVNDKK